MKWKLKVIGGGKELQSSLGPGAAANDPAAGEAGGGGTRWQRRGWAKRYSEGPRPCGSTTTMQSSAAAEKGQNWGEAVCDAAVCG
jgi:hypothetical protein